MWKLKEARMGCKKYYDKYAPLYDSFYCDSYPIWWFFRKITVETIFPYIKKSKLILSLGCGTCEYEIKMAEERKSIVALDISVQMIKVSKKKVKEKKMSDHIELCVADATNLPFKAGSFDTTIVIGGAIAFIPNHKNPLKDISRVTKSNGFVVLDVQNRFSENSIPRKLQKLLFMEMRNLTVQRSGNGFYYVGKFFNGSSFSHYLHYYHEKELRKLLEKHGFEIEKIIGNTILPLIFPVNFLVSKSFMPVVQVLKKIETRINELPFLRRFALHLIVVAKKLGRF